MFASACRCLMLTFCTLHTPSQDLVKEMVEADVALMKADPTA